MASFSFLVNVNSDELKCDVKKKQQKKKIKILTFGPGRTNESFSCGELHCGWKCK